MMMVSAFVDDTAHYQHIHFFSHSKWIQSIWWMWQYYVCLCVLMLWWHDVFIYCLTQCTLYGVRANNTRVAALQWSRSRYIIVKMFKWRREWKTNEKDHSTSPLHAAWHRWFIRMACCIQTLYMNQHRSIWMQLKRWIRQRQEIYKFLSLSQTINQCHSIFEYYFFMACRQSCFPSFHVSMVICHSMDSYCPIRIMPLRRRQKNTWIHTSVKSFHLYITEDVTIRAPFRRVSRIQFLALEPVAFCRTGRLQFINTKLKIYIFVLYIHYHDYPFA